MAKRLLVVDDHSRNRALIEALLRPLGHDLVTADGGHAALALFAAEPFDLVLLDLMMPDLDGLSVLAQIRAHPRGRHVPVILVTAHSEREHRVRGLEAGADDFLEKPIDRAILAARVRTLLQLKESRDELQASRDALAEHNELLERMQRKQRELTQFIVHDLKSPLSVVAANVDFARENLGSESRSPALADALTDASIAAARIRAMIEDLLTIARLEDTEFPVRCEPILLDHLLQPIVEGYARKAQAKKVRLVAPANVGDDCRVMADPSLLRRVLENILDNSLRYTPPSRRVAIETRSGDVIEIRIGNDGPAIPLSERGRVFEKFVRGSGGGPAEGNAGLGLYFCKCAIEAQGGKITVCETPEWPTCFAIELPAAP